MAKRIATSELTDRNWDHEDEPEEAGRFVQATDDVLKQRQIKKPKRKNLNESSSGGAFSGFGGFGKSELPKPASINVKAPVSTLYPNPSNLKTINGKDTDSTYYHSIKSLNKSLLSWLQNHIERDPYCILTPIFGDYNKHLEDIKKNNNNETKNEVKEDEDSDPEIIINTNARRQDSPVKDTGKSKQYDSSDARGFTFKSATSSSTTGSSFGAPAINTGFSFGTSTKTVSSFGTAANTVGGFGTAANAVGFGTAANAGCGFGAAANAGGGFGAAANAGGVFGTAANTGGGFGSTASTFSSFGSTATSGFSGFGTSLSAPTTKSTNNGEEEEEYVPPKVETEEVTEEGSVYSKRCKLFYQKDGSWKDRGIGNIHLKVLEDGKTQVIIRADTNLGNILLNIMLTTAMPTKRQGKNNVWVVCVPNPPIDPKDDSTKPVPMLIRVKTGEDADELMSKLEELKK